MKIFEAAKYLIYLSYEESKYSLTPLKLQKILYFAQGWSYVWDDKPLFSEKFEAWQYGPVNPNVYDRFKKYGNREIPEKEGKKNIIASRSEIETLELVWEKYGHKGAFKLVDISHDERPWREAYYGSGIIKNKDIEKYYKEMYS